MGGPKGALDPLERSIFELGQRTGRGHEHAGGAEALHLGENGGGGRLPEKDALLGVDGEVPRGQSGVAFAHGRLLCVSVGKA